MKAAHTPQRRKRLIVSTRKIASTAPEPSNAKAPVMESDSARRSNRRSKNSVLQKALSPSLAAPGFSACFCRFTIPFHLSRAAHAKIPGGRLVFTEVGPHATPEDVLARHGLKPGPRLDLDHRRRRHGGELDALARKAYFGIWTNSLIWSGCQRCSKEFLRHGIRHEAVQALGSRSVSNASFGTSLSTRCTILSGRPEYSP
jgi:hypothetical protein